MIRHPAALLLAAALAASTLLACTGEEPKPAATETPTAATTTPPLGTRAAVPSTTPTPTATSERPDGRSSPVPGVTSVPDMAPSTSSPIPSLRPGGVPLTVQALSALRGDIVGWFSEPRSPTRIEQRPIEPRPMSSLPAMPVTPYSVVLYDTRAGTARDLGGASTPAFSPNGRLLAWASAPRPQDVGELVILNLATGEERRLGRARSVRRVDDRTVLVYEQENDRAQYDVVTGQRRTGWPEEQPRLLQRYERGGYRIETRWDGDRERIPDYPWHYKTVPATWISDEATLTLESLEALLTPDGELIVATMPVPDPAVPRPRGVPGRVHNQRLRRRLH